MKQDKLVYTTFLLALVALTFWVYSKYYHRDFKILLANQPELNKAYTQYKNSDNKEEKESIKFLIRNMPLQSWQTKYMIDIETKDTLHYSAYDYVDLYLAISALDSLKKGYSLNTKSYRDIEEIDSATLVRNLDLAYKTWKESPGIAYTDFNEFCNYILPYRAGNEKPCEWRPIFKKKYQPYIEHVTPEAVVKKVDIINEILKKEVEFDLRSHGEIYTPSVLETLSLKKGSCRALTELTACIMRSVGIPTAIDACPVWAHRNSGHQWNAVKVNSNSWLPFGGAETNLDEFDSINDSVKAPKVYRFTYEAQIEEIHKKNPLHKLPPIFKIPNKIDVTHEYVPTSDIELEIENIPECGKIAYLGVFNAEEWKIVEWSVIKNGKANFKNMGNNNIVYLPLYYIDNRVFPASNPFILSTEDKIRKIAPDFKTIEDIEITCYNKFYDIEWHEGTPEEGWNMELYYWNNEWISCGVCNVKEDRTLRFKNVPKDALYLIKSYNWENTWQRIFTIDDGEQKWY